MCKLSIMKEGLGFYIYLCSQVNIFVTTHQMTDGYIAPEKLCMKCI